MVEGLELNGALDSFLAHSPSLRALAVPVSLPSDGTAHRQRESLPSVLAGFVGLCRRVAAEEATAALCTSCDGLFPHRGSGAFVAIARIILEAGDELTLPFDVNLEPFFGEVIPSGVPSLAFGQHRPVGARRLRDDCCKARRRKCRG